MATWPNQNTPCELNLTMGQAYLDRRYKKSLRNWDSVLWFLFLPLVHLLHPYSYKNHDGIGKRKRGTWPVDQECHWAVLSRLWLCCKELANWFKSSQRLLTLDKFRARTVGFWEGEHSSSTWNDHWALLTSTTWENLSSRRKITGEVKKHFVESIFF